MSKEQPLGITEWHTVEAVEKIIAEREQLRQHLAASDALLEKAGRERNAWELRSTEFEAKAHELEQALETSRAETREAREDLKVATSLINYANASFEECVAFGLNPDDRCGYLPYSTCFAHRRDAFLAGRGGSPTAVPAIVPHGFGSAPPAATGSPTEKGAAKAEPRPFCWGPRCEWETTLRLGGRTSVVGVHDVCADALSPPPTPGVPPTAKPAVPGCILCETKGARCGNHFPDPPAGVPPEKEPTP